MKQSHLTVIEGTGQTAESGLGPEFTHLTYLKTRRQVAVAAITEGVSLYVTGAPDGLLSCLLIEADHEARRARRKSRPFKAFDGADALRIARAGLPLEVA